MSCNPATLARDAGLLVHQAGYRCTAAGAVNMFPHTAHVESIAVFERDDDPVNATVSIPLWLFVLLLVLAVVAGAAVVPAAGRALVLPAQGAQGARRDPAAPEDRPAAVQADAPPRADRPADERPARARRRAAARLETGKPAAAVTKQVLGYAREIVPAFNAYVYFRVGYWLAKTFARLVYRVRLGYTDDAAIAAINPKSTVVFVMNHRSNMDYILVSFLAAERVALSYAVGEWARIWPLQGLIRAMGAYFVRRNSGDPLYRMVLQRYVQMATEGGVPQAMYPEGGLSVDGRLREPKLGPARLHAQGLQPGRRARPGVHPGGHQLRPCDRGPQPAAQARQKRAARRPVAHACASPAPTSAGSSSSRCSGAATATATPA